MPRAALAVLCAVAGCVADPGFRCHTDAECGGGGVCEPTQSCSFADATCGSGRRYGAHSGAQSSACVGDADGGVPGCNDGVQVVGEECDDGPNNSDDPASSATCTTQCRRRAACGDLTGSLAAKIDASTGHCYVAWSSVGNWQTAQSACEKQGGMLPVIGSSAENTLLRTMAAGAEVWLGLGTTPATGTRNRTFRWSNAEPLAFTAWASGEPDNSGDVEECATSDGSGWHDRPCGWPTTGLLPPSPAQTLPWICEHGCGNSRVEVGEECDPPGPTCTATCQNIRMCDKPAHSSPITGHCYFLLSTTTTQTYDQAKASCRPFGAHLATLNEPAETEAAFTALDDVPVPAGGPQPIFAWIALRTTTTAAPFWDAATNETMVPRRYQGYTDPDPSMPGATCSLVTWRYTTFGTPDGWRDRYCTETDLVMCERE